MNLKKPFVLVYEGKILHPCSTTADIDDLVTLLATHQRALQDTIEKLAELRKEDGED